MPLVDSQDAFMELFTPLHPHSRQVTPSFPPFFQILSSASLLWYVHLTPLWPPPPPHLFFSSPHLPASMEALMSEIKYSVEMRMKRSADPREILLLYLHGQSHRFKESEEINHLRRSKMEKADVRRHLKWGLPLYCSHPPEGDISAISTFRTYGTLCQLKAEWIKWKGFLRIYVSFFWP